MEIHQAPGPPSTSVVLVRGQAIADLEVCRGREAGSIRYHDGTRWSIEGPPGCAEWWVTDHHGAALATLTRTALMREHFAVRSVRSDPVGFKVTPVSAGWRRRWSVTDASEREQLEVIQRPLSRPVHDLRLRSGDVPFDLPLLVAWLVALATSAPLPETRHPRWAVR